jgi:uncharacterized 2Fe-2S/4Fe-4S cluster protein (DUF4445 family)
MSDSQRRESQSCGISVDVGTSQITVHSVSLSECDVAREVIVSNPQNTIGFDIISRVAYAIRNAVNADQITGMVREATSDAILEALESSRFSASSVKEVVIVGNTVMHHLFHGIPVVSLAEAPYTTSQKAAISTTSAKIGLHLEVETPVYSPPIVESFIGPDALMMLVASEAYDAQNRMVAIDVGTNTEIAVCHDEVIWLASAASGPAFEGMSLKCGMPAIEGAIDRVRIGSESEPVLTVIGGGRPRGICGSGAISSIAALLDARLLNSRGSLDRKIRSAWVGEQESLLYYILAQASHSATSMPIYISQVDLRMLQQSKAAIFAVLTLLLEKAGLKPSEVERVFLTGAFGSGIDIQDAHRIGLLPDFTSADVQQMRGGAIMGADAILCEPELRTIIEDLSQGIRYVEMGGDPEFEERFAKALPYPEFDG